MKLLDPKLDVVFKLLFAHANNRDILISLLTAVLEPIAPIEFVEVLNPEIPKDLPADKGALLDIHVRLSNGRHVDVEMQSELHPSFTQRVLYYWARLHSSQLSIGDCYEKLCPTVSILFLNQSLLPTRRFHSTFRVSEVHDHYDLSDALELHFVELPKLEAGPGIAPLQRWMRFLLVHDEKELEELAMSDPDIQRAREALTALSRDPEAQELARQREMAQINLKLIRQFEREEGEATGRAEGETKGRAESLRLAVETACDLLGIEIDVARRESLDGLDVDGLTALLNDLRRDRRWPSGI
jgi:predicted transposase/invertase (TIGR01784 family)